MYYSTYHTKYKVCVGKKKNAMEWTTGNLNQIRTRKSVTLRQSTTNTGMIGKEMPLGS